VNERKEFFKVTIDEIAQEVRRHKAEIQITMATEAEEYRKTLAALESGNESGRFDGGSLAGIGVS
jgi:hypothetical protein